MKRTVLALVLAGAMCGIAAADDGVSVVLAPATEGAATQAAGTRVWVVFLNTGATAARVTAPETLRAAVEAGGKGGEASLRRAEDAAGERVVAPGAFLRVPYDVELPSGVAGDVVVKLKDHGGASAVVAVAKQGGGEREAGSAGAVADSGSYSGGDGTSASASKAGSAASPEEVGGPGRSQRTGVVEAFAKNFRPYEPMYFLVGGRPTAKFQYSFRYQVFDDEGSLAKAAPGITGLNFAYSQTSFWDLAGESKPFIDNSYRPEALLAYDDVLPKDWDRPLGLARVGLQAGVQHESNGEAGADSRSLNVAYVRPIFEWEKSRDDAFFVTVAPRLLAYVGDLNDNPDIREFRGYGDLRVVVGWRDGLQLAAIGRIGEDFDKGSLQLDVSHPLRRAIGGNLDLFLHAQFFTGFGETLVGYDQSTTSFRLGVSLVR